MEETEYQKLRRSSYLSAALTVMGFVIIVSSLIFSYTQIREKEARVNELTELEDQLAKKIEEQEALIKEYEWASSPLAIMAQTKAITLNGIRDPQGRQVYDFSIWLQVPVLLKDKIVKVSYYFDHPTMIKKNRESQEAANGYSVSYRGWGCLSSVIITVSLTDGTIHKLDFNQCTGDQREVSP